MKISPASYVNANIALKANTAAANKVVDGLKSSIVLSGKDDAFVKAMSSLQLSDERIGEMLKSYGITYCKVANNVVHTAAGYNGGFFSVKFDSWLTPALLKESFVSSVIRGDNLKIGGLLNYKDMVDHLKRQDIIQKGLKLHTYELNNKVAPDQAELVAKSLSKLSSKYIRPKDLFFIDSEAFYYDRLDKTAYSIDANKRTFVQMKPTFRTCVFETDKNGNAIGYSAMATDIFQLKSVKTVYNEQQNISEALPPIVDAANNKVYAEAFRFGNSEILGSKKEKASEVLNILSKKLGKNLSKEQLQFVKMYDKDKNVIFRICYYDSSIGRSFVFDEQGSFLYEMEYNKDSFGNIIACSRY